MAWSAITSVVTYSAGNAVPLSNNANEPITVRLRHPGTGSDGIVTFYDDAGAPIQTATVTKTNPISEIAFRTSSATLNYSTSVAFDAPGLTIEPISAPLISTDGLSVSSSLPIAAPNTVPTKPNASWTPFPIGNVSPSSTTGAVGQLIARMPCEFSRVRVWAGNNSGAPVTAITKILAAVSATEGWDPSVGTALTEDQTTGWITGDADGIAVAAASASIGGQEVPSYGSSAIFEISSIPAEDGGRPWLFLRHPWSAANIGYRWLESSNHLYNPLDLAGAYSRYRRVTNADYSYCGASATAGGTALAGAAADNFLCPIFRIDVWAKDDGWVTFDAIGGSTFSQTTNNSETYALSWMRKANAAMLASNANIVTLGVSGATTAHYYAMAQKAIAMSHSQYLLYAVFSSNDGSFNQATTDAMMRRFFSIKNLARDAGKIAIPVVMIHDTVGNSPSLSAIRNAAVAELAAAGPVINLGDILGQASNRNLFVPDYTTDGVHFSQLGNDTATAWLPGKLQDIRNRFPVW